MPDRSTSLKKMLVFWGVGDDSLVAMKIDEVREAITAKARLEENLARQQDHYAFLIACGAGDASATAKAEANCRITQILRDMEIANSSIIAKIADLAQALIADDEYATKYAAIQKSREQVMRDQALWFAYECGLRSPSLLLVAEERITS